MAFVLAIKEFVSLIFTNLLENATAEYFLSGTLLPGAILLLLAVPSIILFVMNLKNKCSVVLPVISLVANTLPLCVLLLSLLPAMLQYTILRGINIIDNAVFYGIFSFFSNNELVIWLCCSALIAGGVLSLAGIKRSKQNEA